MFVSELKLFELLKARIGEKEAEAFVQLMEIKVDKKFDEAKNVLATKEDILHLKEDLYNVRVEFVGELGKLEAKLTMRMFYFSIGQIVIIIGSLLSIIKFMMH